MLKGDQIKPTIFAENNLKSDFTTDELYVFGKYFLFFFSMFFTKTLTIKKNFRKTYSDDFQILI